MPGTRHGLERSSADWLWLAFVVLSSLGLSRAFACATPFAAVSALAALTLPRRLDVMAVLLVWAGNQAIGFGLSHYPHTASTFGWGAAIAAAAVAALVGSRLAGRWVERGGIGTGALALCAAFVIDEAVLVAATGVLPTGSAAFAPVVVLRIFAINAVAFGLLLASCRLAKLAGTAVAARRG